MGKYVIPFYYNLSMLHRVTIQFKIQNGTHMRVKKKREQLKVKIGRQA